MRPQHMMSHTENDKNIKNIGRHRPYQFPTSSLKESKDLKMIKILNRLPL